MTAPMTALPAPGLRAKFDAFFLTPGSPRPLAALRIGVATVLLLQCFLLRDSVLSFLAQDGFVQGGLARYLATPGTPQLAWLVERLAPYGIAETTTIYGFCGLFIAALVAMLLGWHTRVATIAAWALHFTLVSSSHAAFYGIDVYSRVFLFYLMITPCGDALSLDVRAGRRQERHTMGARLGLRLAQLHLCIAYLISAVEKGAGPQWWNGELLWRALQLPVYRQFDFGWLVHVPALTLVAGWATLAAEALYCVLIWPRATRAWFVALIIGLHVGIILFLGLPLFGLIMCVLTFCAFGLADWDETPGSWRTALPRLPKRPYQTPWSRSKSKNGYLSIKPAS